MWEENPNHYFREDPHSWVGTENPIHIVPPVGFEPGSQRWKARQDTTAPTLPPTVGMLKDLGLQELVKVLSKHLFRFAMKRNDFICVLKMAAHSRNIYSKTFDPCCRSFL